MHPKKDTVMKALRDFRRFILIKCAEGNQHEVRAYALDNIDSLARAFHVSPEVIMASVETVQDDRALAERFIETILRAEGLLRQVRKHNRAQAAQASAEVLAKAVQWEGERANLDMPSLLSSALTRRQDMLVFTNEDFTVAVYQAPLLDLSKIARCRNDLTGYVDRNGLHLVWKSGRINLRPQENAKAEKVFFHLRPRAPAVAA